MAETQNPLCKDCTTKKQCWCHQLVANALLPLRWLRSLICFFQFKFDLIFIVFPAVMALAEATWHLAWLVSSSHDVDFITANCSFAPVFDMSEKKPSPAILRQNPSSFRPVASPRPKLFENKLKKSLINVKKSEDSYLNFASSEKSERDRGRSF